MEERRNNKHFAVVVEDSSEECSMRFSLLRAGMVCRRVLFNEASQNRTTRKLQDSGQVKGDNRRKTRAKKQGNEKEMVDL